MPIFLTTSVFLKYAGSLMTNPVREKNTLDTIVRFHDIRRLLELQRCMFSLIGQTYRPLNIILVLQRFTPEQKEQVRRSLEPLFSGSNAPSLEILNWEKDHPKDGRGYLLNTGINAARGRYLAFLDYDDTLYPEAYALVVSTLNKTGAGICFAKVRLMRLRVYTSFFYSDGEVENPPFSGNNLLDLFKHNFCPLHSYVLDKHRIPLHLLDVDTSMPIEEDYDMLLRICAQVPSDFSLIHTNIGCYYFKSDGSNTVASDGLDARTAQLYARIRSKIEQQRCSLLVSPEVQALLDQPEQEMLSIRQLLDKEKNNSLTTKDTNGIICAVRKKKTFILDMLKAFNQARIQSGGFRALMRKVYFIYRTEGTAGITARLRNFTRSWS